MATSPAQIQLTDEATVQDVIEQTNHDKNDNELKTPGNASNRNENVENDLEATLSKNQLKKLKRKQVWEDHREDRKHKRKEQRRVKTQRRREIIEKARADGVDPDSVLPQKKKPLAGALVPVCLILDCGFEEYMRPEEIVSLSGQLVRCYADNRRSKYRSHIFYSSFGGKLKERFDVAHNRQYENWIGAHFVEGDYLVAARQADELMRGPGGGEPYGSIFKSPSTVDATSHPLEDNDDAEPALDLSATKGGSLDSVVYLTSDSPHTLTQLEPYTSYVVGGLVDRNREKGICYRRALASHVRTAKLPIGEYLALSTRHVLTTNQVVEIMLRWLECGDWGAAFLEVIPARKGATLKDDTSGRQDGSVSPVETHLEIDPGESK